MCDCATGAMVNMEVQVGKDAIRDKKYAAKHGVSGACMPRMAEGASVEGLTLLGDAWFGYVKIKEVIENSVAIYMPLFCVGWALTFNVPHVGRCSLGKMKRHFTGVVKTAHGLFPKAFLQESLSSALAGSRAHIISTMDGVQLVATCKNSNNYLLVYHRRRLRYGRRQPLHPKLG
jgi:hypothetical protein